MGRWIVIAVAAFATCGFIGHFAPSIAETAMVIKGYPITWTMIVGVVCLWLGHRLTGRK